jgi:hypothetical protein
VGGRASVPIPGFLRNRIIAAVEATEKKLGRPGTYLEIYTMYNV